MRLFKVPFMFRRKPKPDTRLDEFSEDQCKVDDAVLTMVAMSKKYGSPGTDEMITYVAGKIGNKIMSRGLRGWRV